MEITARNHMFCWTPHTAHVALIPWPDRRGLSNAYRMSTLACNTVTHELSAAVHACLLALEEYRDAMPDDNQRVYADAYLRGNQWIIPACPLCGREHVHGAPGGIHDKGGHRVAHCAPLAGGYVIRPADPCDDIIRRDNPLY